MIHISFVFHTSVKFIQRFDNVHMQILIWIPYKFDNRSIQTFSFYFLNRKQREEIAGQLSGWKINTIGLHLERHCLHCICGEPTLVGSRSIEENW